MKPHDTNCFIKFCEGFCVYDFVLGFNIKPRCADIDVSTSPEMNI